MKEHPILFSGPMVRAILDGTGSLGRPGEMNLHCSAPSRSFQTLWDSINADRAPWDSNPWVWAVTFRRVEA